MKYLQSILFITFLFVATSNAQDYPKVFITPMEGGFHNFIAASLISEKVPVSISAGEEGADFIITGSAVQGTNKWYDTIFGGERDRNQGSIQMVRVSDKTIVWAGSQGDRGMFARSGQKKVAERLAKALRKVYFKNKKKI